MPGSKPVTRPDEGFIDALELLADHVPPGDASDSMDEPPTQTCVVPVMMAGEELTVMVAVVVQPVGKV
jgi:hypothetical protein